MTGERRSPGPAAIGWAEHRDAWGPMARKPTGFDDWPAGKFADHIRANYDPLWRAEADADPEDARALADEVANARHGDDDAIGLLIRAGYAERQAALAILRAAYQADPAAAAWLRDIEWALEEDYAEGCWGDAQLGDCY